MDTLTSRPVPSSWQRHLQRAALRAIARGLLIVANDLSYVALWLALGGTWYLAVVKSFPGVGLVVAIAMSAAMVLNEGNHRGFIRRNLLARLWLYSVPAFWFMCAHWGATPQGWGR